MHDGACTRLGHFAELQTFLLTSPHFQKFLFLPLSAPLQILCFCKKVYSGQGIELNYVPWNIPSAFAAPNFFQLSSMQKLQKVHHASSMKLISAEEHSKGVFKILNELLDRLGRV